MDIWFSARLPAVPSAVTVGNFDGVHTGHRHILERLSAQAAARGLRRCAIVFEPQPAEFFSARAGKPAPCRITPLRDKLRLLADTGCLDGVWVLRFNERFAALEAEAFIRTILRERLDTRYLLVGDDFRFGRNRAVIFPCSPPVPILKPNARPAF